MVLLCSIYVGISPSIPMVMAVFPTTPPPPSYNLLARTIPFPPFPSLPSSPLSKVYRLPPSKNKNHYAAFSVVLCWGYI